MIKKWITEKCGTNTVPEGVPKEPPHKNDVTVVDLTPATVKALCAYASIEATLKAIHEKYDPVDCYVDDLKYKSSELACSVAQFLVRELGIEGAVNEARVKEEDENQKQDW
jgi:hypothetical protein